MTPFFLYHPHHQRGVTRLDWLESYHSFSFGAYRNPDAMAFRSLRVLNDDWVKAGHGFDTHPHANFEIITYMLAGTLAHHDNTADTGNHATLGRGDVQVMSAGSGLTHSEMNGSTDEDVHLLQIWLIPNERNTPPRYTQQHFSDADKTNRWALLAATEGTTANVLPIKADAKIFATLLTGEQTLAYAPAQDRCLWLQIATGVAHVKGQRLEAGDAIALAGEELIITHHDTDTPAEMLLFDLKNIP